MRKRVPSYHLITMNGLAIVVLGVWNHYLGEFGSPESRAKHGLLIQE